MIIGNGMLAKEFREYQDSDDIIIFASGVSNSQEKQIIEFNREKKLLINIINQIDNRTIVYFSTCSMYDNYFSNNEYVKHKLKMEELISTKCKKYIILRLPQVIGNNNKFQLMGFLFSKIKNHEKFDLYDVERNLISIQDIKLIADNIIYSNEFGNKIVNIANVKNIKMIDLVKKIEAKSQMKSEYNLIQKKGSFYIDTSDINDIISDLQLFTNNYIDELIETYHG